MSDYARRLAGLEQVMAARGVDCLLLNNSVSIKYLTGASNTCSWVAIARDGRRAAMVIESDYLDYRKQTILTDLRPFRGHAPVSHFKALQQELGLKEGSVAIEKDHLRFAHVEMLQVLFGPLLNLEQNADLIVEEARLIKTPEELELIGKAAQLALFGMRVARESAVRGRTEMEVASRVREAMLAKGADSSTYLYLASDARSSLAHQPPTKNRLDRGPVTVDIHASCGGFHADMARTIFLDDRRGEAGEAYDHYRGLIADIIRTVRGEMPLGEIQKSFFGKIERREGWIVLAEPVLHGVGAKNFELPRLIHATARWYPEMIRPNMVLACSNMGISSKEGWGVRFEDTFVVTEDEPLVLTSEP